MSIVEVSDFHKSYKNLKAVDGISFSVEEGEIFGILGPNGAGKTTTVECIEGLRTFDSGAITVLGMNPQTHGQQLRKRIGMQLQESALPSDIKTSEALDLYASFYDNPIDWKPLLQQIGLEDKLNARFSQLSGGQKQLRQITLALPLTHVVKLMQGQWFGGQWQDYWLNIVVIIGLAGIGVLVSALTFRWE